MLNIWLALYCLGAWLTFATVFDIGIRTLYRVLGRRGSRR